MNICKSPRSAPSQPRGFTLIELMLTVVVLLIGIVSVAKLIPVALGSDLRNQNDATALIASETLMEEMDQQPLGGTPTSGFPSCPLPAPSGWTAPLTQYYFCDGPDGTGYGILMGSKVAPSPPTKTTEEGCPLNSNGQIDFTGAYPDTRCGGFTVQEFTGTGVTVELRWHVTMMHDSNGVPYRKIFVVAARAGLVDASTGLASFSNVIANLTGVTGKCIPLNSNAPCEQ